MDNYEQTITMLVSYAGDANALVYDAMDAYIEGDLKRAFSHLDEADKQLNIAHSYQFKLLSAEVNNKDINVSVLLVHAMDICMNAANFIQYTRKLLTVLEAKK